MVQQGKAIRAHDIFNENYARNHHISIMCYQQLKYFQFVKSLDTDEICCCVCSLSSHVAHVAHVAHVDCALRFLAHIQTIHTDCCRSIRLIVRVFAYENEREIYTHMHVWGDLCNVCHTTTQLSEWKAGI